MLISPDCTGTGGLVQLLGFVKFLSDLINCGRTYPISVELYSFCRGYSVPARLVNTANLYSDYMLVELLPDLFGNCRASAAIIRLVQLPPCNYGCESISKLGKYCGKQSQFIVGAAFWYGTGYCGNQGDKFAFVHYNLHLPHLQHPQAPGRRESSITDVRICILASHCGISQPLPMEDTVSRWYSFSQGSP